MNFNKNNNGLPISNFDKEIKFGSSKIDDNLLWNSFKEGSRKAFCYIYNENFDKLLLYGIKITQNQDLVEDQLQDFFIYLWNKKENLTIKYSITNYLLFAFRYRLVHTIKKENKNKDLSDWESNEIEEIGMPDQDHLSRVNNVVDVLPIKQREIIYLKYFESLDGSEIADIMGISKGGVYNLLSRAISNLKRKLSDEKLNARV
ncbi:RNA polymerase sigma factor [Flavivirga jejuensis]|uniref:Sigma-70 family RNA polymerase sigma factor n=1 Tax=Flavivirga jejuensis TaxID=870487 RepID=A0ABT8WUX1_9FLAO|nr:sigma-70 family RNA polymerase sigma factor [Flavivirga jejuensis]MDO5976978.1 sigma-70 family RNA polymerase sigma factor [Flavivirga jejuensis]